MTVTSQGPLRLHKNNAATDSANGTLAGFICRNEPENVVATVKIDSISFTATHKETVKFSQPVRLEFVSTPHHCTYESAKKGHGDWIVTEDVTPFQEVFGLVTLNLVKVGSESEAACPATESDTLEAELGQYFGEDFFAVDPEIIG